MQILGFFYYSVILVPGLLQILTFLILFGLVTGTNKFNGHRPSAALIGTGILLSWIAGSAPYWILIHLLIAGIGVLSWRRPTRIQGVAPVIGLFLFWLSCREVSDVRTFFKSTAIWKVGAPGTPGSGNPPERLVELRFGINHDQMEGRFSDHLADYLIRKNAQTVQVEFPIFYSWGIARAMGVIRVDGNDFPTTSGGYGSWSADQPGAPFPKYYFGLSDLSAK
jgi:hypothetical protein